MEAKEKLTSLDWNIQDAKEALACALDMGDWDGCIKYANQLKTLEYQRVTLTAPVPTWVAAYAPERWVPSVNGVKP